MKDWKGERVDLVNPKTKATSGRQVAYAVYWVTSSFSFSFESWAAAALETDRAISFKGLETLPAPETRALSVATSVCRLRIHSPVSMQDVRQIPIRDIRVEPCSALEQ